MTFVVMVDFLSSLNCHINELIIVAHGISL